jgi:hypothetical protein
MAYRPRLWLMMAIGCSNFGEPAGETKSTSVEI